MTFDKIPADRDVESMDTSSSETPAAAEGTSRGMRLGVAALLLAVPLVYLGVRTFSGHGNGSSAPANVEAAQTDLASQESAAQSSPTSTNRISLSLAYINGGQPARAIPVLSAVVAEDKTNAVAWNDLCVAHTLQKEYATAIDECNRALTINPEFQLARNNLKWASDEKSKVLGANTVAAQTAPVHDGAFYLAEGLNDLHAGDYDQSIVAWREMLKLEPKSAVAANNIGTAYMMKKHPDEAAAWFNKAIEFDPGMQLAKNNLAWAQSVQQGSKR